MCSIYSIIYMYKRERLKEILYANQEGNYPRWPLSIEYRALK